MRFSMLYKHEDKKHRAEMIIPKDAVVEAMFFDENWEVEFEGQDETRGCNLCRNKSKWNPNGVPIFSCRQVCLREPNLPLFERTEKKMEPGTFAPPGGSF